MVGGEKSGGMKAKEESPGHPLWLEGKRIRNKQPGNGGRGGWRPVKFKISQTRHFPGGPMVKTLSFHCGFDPWWGN